MSTKLDFLPADIPIIPVAMMGYAASKNERTALGDPRLTPCDREDCCLRGDLAPELRGGLEVMQEALEMARDKTRAAQARRRQRRVFSGTPEQHFGHVFHVEIDGKIAHPPDELAKAMVRGTANDVWEQLRPYAEDSTFHGIDLPGGIVLFRHAQAEGHYFERLMTHISSRGFEED